MKARIFFYLFLCVYVSTKCTQQSPALEQYAEDQLERIIIAKPAKKTFLENSDQIRPTIYLRTNTTQLFTELYSRYSLLDPALVNIFEKAPYLDQIGTPKPFPLQPAVQNILERAEPVLSLFHTRSKNLELYRDPREQHPFFYVAHGSLQIIFALVYAIVTSEPDKNFLFVEKIPFYPGHHNAVSVLFKYPNARWQAFHHPSEIVVKPGETLVEFVTSPNNPDGKFRKPETDASILITDFVFASSAYGRTGTGYVQRNIDWVRNSRASGKHVFSFNSASKQFGRTGDRCGYIWYPISDPYAASIFHQFFNYISISTAGSSSVGLSDFLDLVSSLLLLQDNGAQLRHDANHSLIKRHEITSLELVKRYPGSLVTSVPGSPTLFAKIVDPRIPPMSAAEVIFKDVQTSVSGGVALGADDSFVRVNLTGYSQELADFLNRLAGSHKYTANDLFFSSVDTCDHQTLCASCSKKTTFVANPNNCVISAHANENTITILLPPFTDYEKSKVITIKKTDKSRHPVIVKSDNFTISLKKKNDQIRVQWRQPLFLNGKWHIIKKL